MSWNDPESAICPTCGRLPLCEVVSWNHNDFPDANPETLSTSVWGSELKSQSVLLRSHAVHGLPLCEVVSWNNYIFWFCECRLGLPLCEVVSWNILYLSVIDLLNKSTSVWGSELKYAADGFTNLLDSSTSVWGSELKYQIQRKRLYHRLSTSVWGSELKCLYRSG